MTNDELWKAALGELELLISRANFTTWFKNTFISSRSDGQVVIGVPNAFTKAWLENKYHASILKALQNTGKESVQRVMYNVEAGRLTEQASVPALRVAPAPAKESTSPSGLNPRYTFDSFIVGKGNELARAAASAVAERPGQAYNPLFIYGDAGLGKTHLLQAIGSAILKRNPGAKILYVTCEHFTNEFIKAVRQGKSDSFKNVYRAVDALLIDDIAFLAGKEGTQEEFFHTFNALHDAKKQIVITSDRPPKSIPTLENRLVSRFEWGMIADIGTPDLETRIAILGAKCRERGLNLSPDILQYVATTVHSNVRELEGVLNRIVAYHQLNNTVPSLESTKVLLSSFSGRGKNSGVTPKQVITTVASFYDISLEDLTGNSRKKELVTPRQIAMYLLREELKSSFPSIGSELGGRDHTTAMHACDKIGKEIERDEKIKQDITLIRQRLYVR